MDPQAVAREYRQLRADKQDRNWHGYIESGTINEWNVRLVEEPDEATAFVLVEVLDMNGRPHANQADNMRQVILREGKLARTPTLDESAFLVRLRKERRVAGSAGIDDESAQPVTGVFRPDQQQVPAASATIAYAHSRPRAGQGGSTCATALTAVSEFAASTWAGNFAPRSESRG
jgi:hypothetical protein